MSNKATSNSYTQGLRDLAAMHHVSPAIGDVLRDCARMLDAADRAPLVPLGDLPSRLMGWVGKARARSLNRIELDLDTADLLLSFIRSAHAGAQ